MRQLVLRAMRVTGKASDVVEIEQKPTNTYAAKGVSTRVQVPENTSRQRSEQSVQDSSSGKEQGFVSNRRSENSTKTGAEDSADSDNEFREPMLASLYDS